MTEKRYTPRDLKELIALEAEGVELIAVIYRASFDLRRHMVKMQEWLEDRDEEKTPVAVPRRPTVMGLGLKPRK